MRPGALRNLLLVGATGISLAAGGVHAQIAPVGAAGETEPVASLGDSADDPAIWLHPADPAASLLIGTDKQAGVYVYDLDGSARQFIATGGANNVDVGYQFPLGGALVDLVVASNNADRTLRVYRVDAASRQLVEASAAPLPAGIPVYGLCLYRSPITGRTYVFVNSKPGPVRQFELRDDGSGRVVHQLVRSFSLASEVEGCAADDEHALLYQGEENVGIWAYGAEPGAGTARVMVAATNPAGPLVADVEGIVIYYAAGGAGYLLASSQGSSTYVVYDRLPPHAFLGRFRIAAAGSIGSAEDTDGIDVANFALGPAYPQGVFIAQDGDNAPANQNFKLVRWEAIADALAPPLAVDTTRSPRWSIPPGECTDAEDDDGDGAVDYPNDPGCRNPYSRRENPACDDGVDNDRDGLVDFGSDPQCSAAWDTTEAPSGCGLGFELAPLLAGLLALRRVTRGRCRGVE